MKARYITEIKEVWQNKDKNGQFDCDYKVEKESIYCYWHKQDNCQHESSTKKVHCYEQSGFIKFILFKHCKNCNYRETIREEKVEFFCKLIQTEKEWDEFKNFIQKINQNEYDGSF